MPLSTTKRELLTQSVVFNGQVLTARVAARLFRCSVSDARQYLREFHEGSDGRTHATFCVSGYLEQAQQQHGHSNGASHSDGDFAMSDIPSSSQVGSGHVEDERCEETDEMQCIMLIQGDELEDKLPLFSRVLSNEVYSVEPSRLPDLVLLTAANAPLLTDPALLEVDPAVIGTIAHYRKNVTRAAASTSKTAVPAKAATSKPELKRKASTDVSAKSTNPSDAVKPSTTTKPAVSSKLASSTSAKNKELETGTETKDKGKAKAAIPTVEVPSKSSRPTSRTTSSTSAKGKQVQSKDDDMDIDEFAGMLDDDDDELLAEINGLDAPKAATSKAASTTKANPPSGRPHVRKTRRVTKKVTTKNDKGFRVTKEVETDESYSGTDSDNDVVAVVSSTRPKAPPKKEKEKEASEASSSKPAAKSKKSAPKPGEQSSLKTFFGKPKPAKK